MRFGRRRQSVIDPPKKRQKEFTDYGEYQRRLALYNDSTDAFQVSSNMEKYFDARLGNNQYITTRGFELGNKQYLGNPAVIEAHNMEDFTEFAKTPGNTLPKPKYKTPTGKRYSEDGLFYSAGVRGNVKDNTVNVVNTDSERLYYENYKPMNPDNHPVAFKEYDANLGGIASNEKYDLASEAVRAGGKVTFPDKTTYDYSYEPYGTSYLQLHKYAEPQVEPVFTGTPPSKKINPPRKQESIVSLPTKEYQFPRPNALELIDPMPKIYSRKLDQRGGQYIYETSQGTVRKKIGVEDARYYHQNRKAIDAMRRNR